MLHRYQGKNTMSMPFHVPEEYLLSLLQTCQSVLAQFTATIVADAARPDRPLTPTAMFERSMRSVGLMTLQQEYLRQIGALWSSTLARQAGQTHEPVASPAKGDRRFAGAEWREQPYHDLLKQSYLIHSRFLGELAEQADVDDRTRGRLRFFARQFLDALSPANYLMTNPEALRQALETRGESLADGFRNLAEDLRKGRISMTDESAFEVGGNLAISPGAVVFENELIQLIQYSPSTEAVGRRPLLIVPPCINKFYILDLEPGNSFVRYAVEQGHTVFLVSWRNAPPALGHLDWNDYLALGVLQAIDTTLEITGADKLNALGFCVGGTLLGCAVAVARGRNEDKVASLTLLTTMLDFADTGEIGLLIDEASVAAREASIGQGGLLSGRELAFVFSTLRSNDLIWSYVVSNYLKGATPDAFDLLYWNADSTNLPGPMYCWYVRNAYLENNIRVPGRTVQCGVPVDLSKLDMPAYLLAAREDHIVPWQTAHATRGLVSGEARFVLGASGHIAGVVNPASRNKRNFWVDGEPGPDPEHWLSTAQSVPGSWWSDWSAWLAPHRGEQVPARTALGSERYPAIEPAPGRFVKERLD